MEILSGRVSKLSKVTTSFLKYSGIVPVGPFLCFATSIIACSILYFKTRKTLKKYEKEFLNELKNLSEQEKREVLKKSKVLSQISTTNREVI